MKIEWILINGRGARALSLVYSVFSDEREVGEVIDEGGFLTSKLRVERIAPSGKDFLIFLKTEEGAREVCAIARAHIVAYGYKLGRER